MGNGKLDTYFNILGIPKDLDMSMKMWTALGNLYLILVVQTWQYLAVFKNFAG